MNRDPTKDTVSHYCLSLTSNSHVKHSMVHQDVQNTTDDIDMLLNNFNDLADVVAKSRDKTKLQGWSNVDAMSCVVCVYIGYEYQLKLLLHLQ